MSFNIVIFNKSPMPSVLTNNQSRIGNVLCHPMPILIQSTRKYTSVFLFILLKSALNPNIYQHQQQQSKE